MFATEARGRDTVAASRQLRRPAPSEDRSADRQSSINPRWAALTTHRGPAGRIQRKQACACGGTCPQCRAAAALEDDRKPQFRLQVGPANDSYEREAESIAGQVMRMPDSWVQRRIQATGKQEDERVQTAPIAGRITSLAQSGTASGVADGRSPGRAVEAVVAGGQPLPAEARRYFEPRFGYSFDNVLVHTDAHAQRSAADLRAKAYTIGTSVVFGAGEYDPASPRGRHLLAHELTHVVQQSGSGGRVQRKTKEKTPCAIHTYDASNPKDTAVIPDDKSGIGVTSVPDLIAKVNAHVDDEKNGCSCVSRLEINGHGTDGYQSVGNGDLYVNDDKAIVHDSAEDHLKSLTKIKFCDRALFMLMGCHVGQGKGKDLLSKLATLLPGKLIGGAQHFTAGTGLGKKKVTGEGDKSGEPMSKRDPFLTSEYVRWHLVIDGKEYVIPGKETTTPDAKSKLKAAQKIKVKTPDGVEIIK
jgi:hypothetical protein